MRCCLSLSISQHVVILSGARRPRAGAGRRGPAPGLCSCRIAICFTCSVCVSCVVCCDVTVYGPHLWRETSRALYSRHNFQHDVFLSMPSPSPAWEPTCKKTGKYTCIMYFYTRMFWEGTSMFCQKPLAIFL